MVGATGIEPETPAMSRQCSTAELRAHRSKCGRLHRRPRLGKYDTSMPRGPTARDLAVLARYDAGMDLQAFDCHLPERQTTPVVVASPHSGSVYPADFLARAAVSSESGLRENGAPWR